MSEPHVFFSFFPQFNADPINDKAWGEGFTDWDLIRDLPEAARQKFTPYSGFYDPSTPEYLTQLQLELAKLPIENPGLMVYHYHFDGVYALSRFEQQVLRQKENAPPFFLCWANETWSKRWIGKPLDVLIEQQHLASVEVIHAHAVYLTQFFKLPSYHHVDGRPLLLIYNVQASQSLPQVLKIYRKAFEALGQNPLIGACIAHPQPDSQLKPYDFGCEFQPRFFFNHRTPSGLAKNAAKLKMRFPKLFDWLGTQRDSLRRNSGGQIFEFRHYLEALSSGKLEAALRSCTGDLPLMRSTFLSWDNAPRYRRRSTQVTHDTVDAAALGVIHGVRSDSGLPLLVNSWNEWSEGAALESSLQPHRLRIEFLQCLAEL